MLTLVIVSLMLYEVLLFMISTLFLYMRFIESRIIGYYLVIEFVRPLCYELLWEVVWLPDADLFLSAKFYGGIFNIYLD